MEWERKDDDDGGKKGRGGGEAYREVQEGICEEDVEVEGREQ